jgi:hypothetical protein
MFLHNKFDYHQKLGGSSDLYLTEGVGGVRSNTGRTEQSSSFYLTNTTAYMV